MGNIRKFNIDFFPIVEFNTHLFLLYTRRIFIKWIQIINNSNIIFSLFPNFACLLIATHSDLYLYDDEEQCVSETITIMDKFQDTALLVNEYAFFFVNFTYFSLLVVRQLSSYFYTHQLGYWIELKGVLLLEAQLKVYICQTLVFEAPLKV